MKALFPPIFIILIFYFVYLILLGLGFKDLKSIMEFSYRGMAERLKPKLYKRKPKYVLFGMFGALALILTLYLLYK